MRIIEPVRQGRRRRLRLVPVAALELPSPEDPSLPAPSQRKPPQPRLAPGVARLLLGDAFFAGEPRAAPRPAPGDRSEPSPSREPPSPPSRPPSGS